MDGAIKGAHSEACQHAGERRRTDLFKIEPRKPDIFEVGLIHGPERTDARPRAPPLPERFKQGLRFGGGIRRLRGSGHIRFTAGRFGIAGRAMTFPIFLGR